MKNSQFLVFYIKKFNSSQRISYDLFWPLHKKPVIYHTKFATYLFFNHFTHKIYYLPKKFINFLLLVSSLLMVSPGAARPLRLSTPLVLCVTKGLGIQSLFFPSLYCMSRKLK